MIKHIHLKECDSTQDVLKEQLSVDEQILVSCENQIAGRGRGTNSWLSMPGTLTFSFTLIPHAISSFTSIEIAVLIALYFEKQGSFLKLKWPNDLFNQHNKKCAGILLQGSQEKMLAGVGINFQSNNPELGAVFDKTYEIDKMKLSFEITDFINQNRFKDTSLLKKKWIERCFHLNQQVRITEGADVTEGIFTGLGGHGEALIETKNGTVKIYNGTLRLL